MAKRFLTPLNLTNLASDPASGTEGDLYFNTTDDVVKIYVNGAWTELQGGAGGVGGASVIYSPTQPDVTDLEPGTIWMDSDADIAEATRGIGSYTRWTKLLSGSASVITGDDDDGTDLDFTTGLEQVYVNGVFIDESSYTTNGTSITFSEPLYNQDLIEILWLENLAIANIYTKSEVDSLLGNIDLTETINTASAAAFASASAYTNSASSSLIDYTNIQISNIDLSTTIQTASAAAVTYITNGAPEALDTLLEISDALNNDPDILNLYLTQSSASTLYEKNIPYSSSTPSNPTQGDLWVDSTTTPPALKTYDGTGWVQLGAAVDDSQAIIASRMFT